MKIKEVKEMGKERLDPNVFFKELDPEKIREGYFSDVYFNRAKDILQGDGCHTKALMQVFQRNEAVVCGIDEAIAILKIGTGFYKNGEFVNCWDKLTVKTLHDGDKVKPFETVMTIEGDYSLFPHLETLYLGVLARRTKVATNVKRVVEAANGRSVLFFPARFDHPHNQTGDGYAAYISGSLGVSTDAQAAWWGAKGLGTIPHSLIAIYGGDTVKATIKFAEWAKKQKQEINIVSLVDFENDCVNTSLALAKALGKDLWGVRLDTSASMVDRSLWSQMRQFDPRGVNPQLVRNVREALDEEGFNSVKIIVSGGFDPVKIREFEEQKVPVDVYAVGSSFFKGTFDYTADIVMVDDKPCAKVGRKYQPNPRLETVK